MFDFLKKKVGGGGGMDKDVESGRFTIEWSSLSSTPSDGKKGVKAWDDARGIFQRFVAEAPGSDAFVILSHTPQHYVQAAINDRGLVLEYQAGDTDAHFEAAETVTPALVLDIAEAYMLDPGAIDKMCAWTKMEI